MVLFSWLVVWKLKENGVACDAREKSIYCQTEEEPTRAASRSRPHSSAQDLQNNRYIFHCLVSECFAVILYFLSWGGRSSAETVRRLSKYFFSRVAKQPHNLSTWKQQPSTPIFLHHPRYILWQEVHNYCTFVTFPVQSIDRLSNKFWRGWICRK